MLRRRSGVRRSGLSLQMVQGGRGGGGVRQGRGRFQRADVLIAEAVVGHVEEADRPRDELAWGDRIELEGEIEAEV